jgi:SRSO17 transposase
MISTLPFRQEMVRRRNMAAEKRIAKGTELTTIGDWSASLEVLHAQIARHFVRAELRERVRRYLSALLERVERKNGWQLAEAIGEAGPQGVQRLLNNAKWDADLVRDDLREYIVEHLADENSGLLIVDETGFLKKGEKSVGVARQYTGTAGETVNAQVGVFLAYASKKGTAFIDRALYLPKEWTEDPARCAEAGIPETVGFATKIELAKRMLKRAFKVDVPAKWVAADSFYGRSHGFRHWLEKRGLSYAVMVPKTLTPSVTKGVERRSTNWSSAYLRKLGRRSLPKRRSL